MNAPLLKRLSEAHGTPGQEEAIRTIIIEELKGIAEFSSDAMGNLICFKKGKTSAKKLMIAAHMDEIGFVVKYIDNDGFLRIAPLGGWDPRQMSSQRVFVHTENGAIQGLMMPSVKPRHMLSAEEASKGFKIEDFFIDLGLTGEEVKSKVSVGDRVTMDRDCRPTGNHMTGKAMDNRVAVYCMIEAMRNAGDHDVDVYGVATVQEEIGLRGAIAAGSGINPDMCVAIDVTLANDIPGIPESDHVTKLGKGVAIKILDSSLICSPLMVKHFKEIAAKHDIPNQPEILTAGGTDAGGVQKLNGGIPAFTLSVPCRYVHTVNETIHPSDLDACTNILARYIEDAHNGDYIYKV